MPILEGFQLHKKEENTNALWEAARQLPHRVADLTGDFIVQMIDEFQFLTSHIYRDRNCERLDAEMAGGYLSTAESKIAPLLVTGSWVTWLMNSLNSLLPARFKYNSSFGELSLEEAQDMVYRYSDHFRYSWYFIFARGKDMKSNVENCWRKSSKNN